MTTQAIPRLRSRRRLRPEELRAWLAFIRAGLYSLRAMDRDAIVTGRPPFSEHHILATLDGGAPEGMRPTDLAEWAALTKSGLTRAVDRLDSEGLIERRPCPGDARGQLIVLTAAGRRILRRSAPEHFRSIARHFADHLTDREMEAITAGLERVAAATTRD